MNLGYKQYFPFNKQWTNFEHKILAGLSIRDQRDHVKASKALYANLPESKRIMHTTPFIDNMGVDPKLHSIREDIHDRWKSGMKIHHSFGVRTKSYRCFLINRCISTQRIVIKELLAMTSEHCFLFKEYVKKLDITLTKVFQISVDGRALTKAEIDLLAKNDGFDSTNDFFRWFNGNYVGKIIHWTNYKY